jgi:L-threonylcarbamoyladenylate synthase
VPGKLESHYQPEKPLYFFNTTQALQTFIEQTNESVYVLSFSQLSLPKFYFCFPPSPEQTAYELYYQLRQADESETPCIAIELPPPGEEWQAVRERIVKAGKPI